MANGRAQTQRATPRAVHGNVTGNAAIQLNKEHADEVRARQVEMSTASITPDEEPDDFVDLSDDAGVNAEKAAARRAELEAQQLSHQLSSSGLQITAQPVEPRRKLRSVSARGEADPDEVVEGVRFNDNYDGVTIGKDPQTGTPRTFNFEARRKYSMPRWLHDHFDSKEMLV